MRTFTLLLLGAVFALAPQAYALTFADGGVHVIDGVNTFPFETVEVRDGPSASTTTLNVVGGQISTLHAVYDLESGTVDVSADTRAAQVDPLLRALTGDSPMAGMLTSRFELAGPPTLPGLAGRGTFEVSDGQLRGVSIMKTVLGEISALPILVARARGVDLSRYEEEEFRRLAGDFRLRGEYARIDNLVLEYRNATVDLAGTVGVPSGELNLKGTLTLSEELDAELAGTAPDSGRRRVIPITGVRGTVSKPEIILDREALSLALSTYATGGKLREKLERSLGTDGADVAVAHAVPAGTDGVAVVSG